MTTKKYRQNNPLKFEIIQTTYLLLTQSIENRELM